MKIIGIDLGQARTGVCVSDLSGFLAGRSITIAQHNRDKLLEEICREVAAEKPGRIVVGLPLNMNGTEGPKALECREYAARRNEYVASIADRIVFASINHESSLWPIFRKYMDKSTLIYR